MDSWKRECPNSLSGKHDFEVHGKNKERARWYGVVPCRYCGNLKPYENKKPLEDDATRG